MQISDAVDSIDQGSEYIGSQMHKFAWSLWPINRSITGDGVRQTLALIQKQVSGLRVYEIPSGTKVYDWTIPKEIFP
jgi:aminopeptidase-like protein